MATVSVEHSGGSGASGSTWGWGAGTRQTVAIAATCFLVPVTLGGEPGSGGAVTPEAALSRHQWLQDASIDVTTATSEEAVELRTPAERLEWIRQALGLTVTDLARLLGASRPTVYAWLNGQEPRPDVQARLARLEQQAEGVAACELPRLNKLIRRPLRCGGSLLERLQQGDPLEPALVELRALSQRERASRSRRKGQVGTTRTMREGLDDVATPLDRRG